MKTKKLIALLLSLVMVVGLLPTMALAVREPYYDIEFTEDGVTSEYSACVDSEITIGSINATKTYIISLQSKDYVTLKNKVSNEKNISKSNALTITGGQTSTIYAYKETESNIVTDLSAFKTTSSAVKSKYSGCAAMLEALDATLGDDAEYYFVCLGSTSGSNSVKLPLNYIILIEITPNGAKPPQLASDSEKAILQAEIDKVTVGATNYYQTADDDRYNGKPGTAGYSTAGFWADLQPFLTKAQSVIAKTNPTANEVDSAYTNLSDAIANLIPKTQINPTELYEAIHTTYKYTGNPPAAKKITNPDDVGLGIVTAANTTAASWSAYQTALTNANTVLAGLFTTDGAGNTVPSVYNNANDVACVKAVTDALTALNTAVAGLDMIPDQNDGGRTLNNAVMAYDGLAALANNIFNPARMDESAYADWDAFLTARNTALSFYNSHSAPAEGIGFKEAQRYVDAYAAFWKACYKDLTSSDTVSATVYVTDVFALRKGLPLNRYVGVYELTGLPADNTLAAAMESKLGAGWAAPRSQTLYHTDAPAGSACALGVFVNGVYLFSFADGNSSGSTNLSSKGYADIHLHNGDTVVLAIMEAPTYVNLSGSRVPYTAFKAISDVQYLETKQGNAAVTEVDAVAGEALTLQATHAFALPYGYSGSRLGLADAAVYVSEGCGTKEDAMRAAPTEDAGVVTGADGSFSLRFYGAGWYSLGLMAAGERGGLVNGPTLLVHVTDPADLSGIRAELKAKLDKVHGAYGSEFYTEAQKAQLDAYYLDGDAGVTNGATSAAIYAAAETALSGMEAIQTANEKAADAALANVRFLLAVLPTVEQAQAKRIYWNDNTYLDALVGADGVYTAMTPYQRGLLLEYEKNAAEWFRTFYANITLEDYGLEADEYSLTLEVRDADTGAVLPYEEAPVQFNAQDFDRIAGLQTDADGYLSFSTTPVSGQQTWYQAEGPRTLNGFKSNYLGYVYWGFKWSDNTGLNFITNGYELVDYSFSADNYFYYEKQADNWGRADSYPLRENVVLTVYVRKTAQTADALAAERATALDSLETAYKAYKRSNYSTAKWTTLYQAYQDGVSAINAATTPDAIESAKTTAINAMKAVPEKEKQEGKISGWGSSDTDPFDAGAIVGTVTITAENKTFPGGDFPGDADGVIFRKTEYEIGINDNMMTVILRALADEHFTWEGTGGSAADAYDIGYLAKIKKGGKEMGEFSGDPGSGWMGSLNDFMVNEGLNQFSVANGMLGSGDEIKLMFTQNLGVDLGGTWGNSDTTVATLEVSGGTMIPGFAGGTAGGSYDFALKISGERAVVTVTPHASNINYQVRTFLNEKVTTEATGNSYYRRGEGIPVRPGDVIWVGCGERAWPSMNKQGAEARSYTGTWYAIHVISADSGADYVNALIAKLPAAARVKYSNYEDVRAQVEEINAVIAVLSDSEKAKVKSMKAVTDKIADYAEIDAVKDLLAALPKNATDAQVLAAADQIRAAEAAYKALEEWQQDYITVGDAANYNALVKKWQALTPEEERQNLPQLIVGGSGGESKDKKKDEGGNTITAATVTVTPEVADGKATAEVSVDDVTAALTEAGKDAEVLTVKVETEGADTVAAGLPADAVKAAADAGVGLNVETENGTVKVDAGTLAEAAKAGKAVAVTVTENADGTTTVGVTVGGKAVEADVKIELEAKDGQMLVVVGPDGTETPVILSATEDGTVYAKVPAGSTVKVVDAEGKDFGDVNAGDWFAEAVEFVSSHGIFQGTGDGTFAPGTTMNRAMLAMVLYRIDGAAGGGQAAFGDVDPGAWYADAVSWAADAGIVNGRGEGFAPDAPVTREEIATMLYRFVKHLGVDVSGATADLSKFPDGGDTSPWAGEAMQWAVSVGLFRGGSGGALNPGGEATRAEVATLVERLVTLLVK